MNEADDPDALRLFPRAECVAAISELSAWTSVQTILAAARHIEGRPTANDKLEPMLIVPFDDDEHGVFASAIFHVMEWLVAGYRVPEPKIVLARSLDTRISNATAHTLSALRFKPEIYQAKPGVLSGVPDGQSALVLRDDPAVIEMIQAPLICMMESLHDLNNGAKQIRLMLNARKEETGGAGKIFHRAYADSRLSAVLDAICYYVWGHDFGPHCGQPGHCNVDISYRAINVQGIPPIDARFFETARESMEMMLDSLR